VTAAEVLRKRSGNATKARDIYTTFREAGLKQKRGRRHAKVLLFPQVSLSWVRAVLIKSPIFVMVAAVFGCNLNQIWKCAWERKWQK
jgi:hypothetical protein